MWASWAGEVVELVLVLVLVLIWGGGAGEWDIGAGLLSEVHDTVGILRC